MKANLVEKYDNYSLYSLKYKKGLIYFYVDNIYSDKLENLSLRVSKRKFRNINNIDEFIIKYRLNSIKNVSFLSLLTGEKKRYYLKDSYTNLNEEIIDYRFSSFNKYIIKIRD